MRDDDGHTVADFYTSGVETAKGQQVDVFGPFTTRAAAMGAANDLARVINEGAGRRTVEARAVPQSLSDPSYKRQIAVWLAAFLSAIVIGGIWEVAAGSL